MRTVRRMLYRDITLSVVFVALAFLSLSFFIDFVDELQQLGRPGFTLWAAVVGALLGSLTYFNSINITQSWVANGRLGMASAFITLHGGVFLAALALLWWRDHAAVLGYRLGTARKAAR